MLPQRFEIQESAAPGYNGERGSFGRRSKGELLKLGRVSPCEFLETYGSPQILLVLKAQGIRCGK